MSTTNPLSTPYASASLYIGDLNPDVTEALLFEIFNPVGPVASVRVCRDAVTRRSLGYAYVNFHRVEDAERALDTMNYKPIRNRPCRIMWSHRDPSLRKSGLGNIFVKNLAKPIDNKTLYDTFSMFGNILSCKVATDHKGQSRGYGFVHYESEESAQNAIARVDGKVIAGQTVNVSQFKSRKERGGTKPLFNNVYVKNLPEDYSLKEIENLFSPYGTVTSAKLATQDKDAKNKGSAYVCFSKPEEAQAAIVALTDKEFGDKKLYLARHQKKEERERDLRQKFEQRKLERQRQYGGVNLYVKNLADSIDDARLLAEFSKFGPISSAKVMTDTSTGKSKGFGFVCFSNNDDATKVVTEMNGRMIENKPLYVALAQRKDLRRAQLEAQYAARTASKLGLAPPVLQPQLIYPHPQQRMLYPQQMIPRARWPPQGSPPQVMGVRGNVNYLMPLVGPRPQGTVAPTGVPTGGRGAGRGGGGRGGGGGGRGRDAQGGPRRPPQQGGQAPPPQAGYKYNNNARNQQTPQQPASSGSPLVSDPTSPTAEPLTIKTLAAAPEEQKKQMIGEALFPLIKEQQPELAGKITGMLLEMDNGELLHLLESRDALHEKIEEALAVLQSHDEDGGDEDEE
jgi:polyadenylate-binding protein